MPNTSSPRRAFVLWSAARNLSGRQLSEKEHEALPPLYAAGSASCFILGSYLEFISEAIGSMFLMILFHH